MALRCGKCGLMQNEGASCKRCGAALTAPAFVPRRAPAAPGHPLLTFWTAPRATIADIARTDPDRNVVALAWLAGTGEVIVSAVASEKEGPGGPLLYVLIALVIGPPAGFVRVYLSGLFLGWTGRRLGGSADDAACRAAFAWSLLPLLLATALIVPLYLMKLTLPAAVLLLMGFGWCEVLLVKTVSEVHDFSAWRSVGTLALSAVVGAVCTISLVLALYLLVSHLA